MNKTQEIQSIIEPTFVIDFLQAIIHTEIYNPITRRGNTLFINLSNHSTARVTAPKVDRNTPPPVRNQASIENFATLQYIAQHDYNYRDEQKKQTLNHLELRNFDECRVYIEDIIRTQLNAYYTDGLIEFIPDGEKFLLTVELKH